jgi:hypothetical protein
MCRDTRSIKRCQEITNRVGELSRVRLENFAIGFDISNMFKSHERDLVNEREIPNQESSKIMQVWGSLAMQHYSDFDPQPASLRVQDPANRLIKGAPRLNHEVMSRRARGIDRNTKHEIPVRDRRN